MASLSDLYWSMMAGGDSIPAMTDPNAYVNKIQGDTKPQLTPQQQQDLARQQALQNQAARLGQAVLTPQEIQRRQIAEILRRRGLPSQ